MPCSPSTRTQMTIATSQRDVKAIVTSTRAEITEVRDLLVQLFASNLEPDKFQALQSRDTSLAERLMEAGQRVRSFQRSIYCLPLMLDVQPRSCTQ